MLILLLSMQTLLFYFFAFLILIAAMNVIVARNPVHAVLFLILAFVNASVVGIMLGAEFISMSLIIVYVGAVAVLFLFVVMMLDISYQQLKKSVLYNIKLGLLVGFTLWGLLVVVLAQSKFLIPNVNKVSQLVQRTNTELIGLDLYTKYFFAFQMAGAILLVAMIGAIVLTLSHEKPVRRQNISEQIKRRREDGVKLVDVKLGQGVEL
jgi:NADH-quinone oxidoreductase subunit J